MIQVLDSGTINQIAAGEVVERPVAVVKELVENAIDAEATAITIEIKEGGISFIRVTDNGTGIAREEIKTAFLRHATSKIRSIEDLLTVRSLGFRGEALASIAAVAQVELITRQSEEITGARYEIAGGEEISMEEIGCPSGTTFIVRNLFYNTPARRKFLKTKTTEGNYISDMVLCYSLAHPEIRFTYICDGRNRLQTSGDGDVKTNIFYNYGTDVTQRLIPVSGAQDDTRLSGYIGKPELSRGTRGLIHYFVNGRYIKSPVITKAIEDAYSSFLMNHRYPFAVLHLTIPSSRIDVNVHPTKMEIRFTDQEGIYQLFYDTIHQALNQATLIPQVSLEDGDSQKKQTGRTERAPEPFEEARQKAEEYQMKLLRENLSQVTEEMSTGNTLPSLKETSRDNHFSTPIVQQESSYQSGEPQSIHPQSSHTQSGEPQSREPQSSHSHNGNSPVSVQQGSNPPVNFQQSNLLKEELIAEDKPRFRIIGQVFDTYWLLEYGTELLIIDQHAAHEKVLYERLMKKLADKEGLSQNLAAPIVVSLSGREQEILNTHRQAFEQIGYCLEEFGDREYLITAVPADFLNLDSKELFLEILDSFMEEGGGRPEMIVEHCATMACKAAVKGNNALSLAEAKELFEQMLQMDQPYHCPHGRPTTIAMSKREFEKKFKRIV